MKQMAFFSSIGPVHSEVVIYMILLDKIYDLENLLNDMNLIHTRSVNLKALHIDTSFTR